MQRDEQPHLAAGTTFHSTDRRVRGVIQGLLGKGGQGAVYKVDYANRTLALKWYHDSYVEVDRLLSKRLTKAIDRGAPDHRFLWPLELVFVEGRPSFGYLMPLRSASCVGMSALLAPAAERVNLDLRRRIVVCLNIARSFYALHARGFCYQDVNFGNIFLYPGTGDVLICDNDNVDVDGADDASIYGTRKFMAPEVVRRESLPNTRTDLYSMAVMFFYVLMGWHPLEGAREHAIDIVGPAEEMRIYGSEPLFMFDPRDARNGPVLPYHGPIVRRWQALDGALRELFQRSFGEGLLDPYRRVVESEWIGLFEALENAVDACPGCGYEHLAGLPRAGEARACVHCGSSRPARAVLKIGRRLCVLDDGRVVPRSLTGEPSSKSWESLGIVEKHPQIDDALGIRNLSDADWDASLPGQADFVVKAGAAVRILDGLQLRFPGAHGQIVASRNSA
jgi:DNA-binding helix-hairpin-helix protein with protein kinase domain